MLTYPDSLYRLTHKLFADLANFIRSAFSRRRPDLSRLNPTLSNSQEGYYPDVSHNRPDFSRLIALGTSRPVPKLPEIDLGLG